MKLILASQSPRRKEILSKAGFVFDIIPSLYDEKVNGKKYTKELIENCAFNKALDVQKRIGLNFAILSADTVVVLDNLILGKPKDVTDASNILNSLSNKTHFVATSICVLYQDKIIKDTEITKEAIAEDFNKEIANLVDGVTKISKLNFSTKNDQNMANTRKIITGNFRSHEMINFVY